MQKRSPPWLVLGVLLLAAAAGIFWILSDRDAPDAGGPALVEPNATETATDLPPALPVDLAGAEDQGTERVAIDTHPQLTVVVGRVVDPGGEPVAGALVVVYAADTSSPLIRRSATGHSRETREDGTFRFVELPEETVGFEIIHDDFASTFVDRIVPVMAATVDVGDVVLRAGITLAGTVSDTIRRQLSGATVRVLDLTAVDRDSDGPPSRSATTDTQGAYEIRHLAMSRQYRIEASADGYGSIHTVISFVLAIPKNAWTQDFVLEAAGSALGGIVVDGYENPVPSAAVRLTRRNRNTNGFFEVTAETGPNGQFLFESIPDGRYDVRVEVPGYYLSSQGRLEAGLTDHVVHVLEALSVEGILTGMSTPPEVFTVSIRPDGRTGAGLVAGFDDVRTYRSPQPPGHFLADGLRPGTYVFEVSAKGYATTRSQSVTIDAAYPHTEVPILLRVGGSIRGQLLDAAGGAKVELRRADYDPGLAIEGAFPTRPIFGLVTQTDAEGNFELAHVPPDVYTLSLLPQGAPPLHRRDVVVVEEQVTDLGGIRPPRGGTLTGSVTDGAGQPAAGIRVTATGMDHFQTVTTDAEGHFVFNILPTGDYEIVAVPTAFWEALRIRGSATAHVSADHPAEVELRMSDRTLVPDEG